ncbi:hypothetical protein QEM13_004414 [Pseudomonas putida]|nr:hypothetical protein [Pseudomonas putida]
MNAAVARIGAYDVFIAMQQLSDFRHVGHTRGSAMDMMHLIDETNLSRQA